MNQAPASCCIFCRDFAALLAAAFYSTVSYSVGVVTVAFLLSSAHVHAEDLDFTNLGGALTSTLPPKAAVTLPSPNTTDEERFAEHLDGFVTFNHSFYLDKDSSNRYILGPRYNHESCGSCHGGDGKGDVSISTKRNSTGSAMLLKVSRRGLSVDGTPRDVPGIGEQILTHTRGGLGPYKLRLSWREIRGYYRDGRGYKLRRPLVSFDIPTMTPAQERRIGTSLRMSPALIGMGLLEAIPAETIIGLSDPQDLDRDGISGKVQWIWDRRTGDPVIGRFGFRGSHATVAEQTAAAFFHDMGITNALFNDASSPEELSDRDLDVTVKYLQFAGVPAARNQTAPNVVAGQRIFKALGCNKCHVMTLQTGPSIEVPEVSNQTIHPFTDLLLHDMGPELADTRPEFRATGREWRTTPLWGIGIFDQLNDKRVRYLHDGRARTLEEAILWHGGEAAASRRGFKSLSRTERDQLIAFLRSL